MSLWPQHPREQDNQRQAAAGAEIAARILERVADEHARAHRAFRVYLSMHGKLRSADEEPCRFSPWTDRGL